MMFGTDQVIREEFSNIFMDYCNETEVTLHWQLSSKK